MMERWKERWSSVLGQKGIPQLMWATGGPQKHGQLVCSRFKFLKVDGKNHDLTVKNGSLLNFTNI